VGIVGLELVLTHKMMILLYSSCSVLRFRLASLQTSFVTLDEALKVTNRRVNALENVTIPKIEGVLAYIDRELDELEREDFTRLKLVQGKKEIQHKVEQELKDRAAAQQVMSGKSADKENDADMTAAFDVNDDADVVF
jgi:V-type H+-transporting ATPase subunit D